MEGGGAWLPPSVLLLVLILHTTITTCRATPNPPGWREQTDWSEESDKDSSRSGPHLLQDLPSNVSVTAGRLATLPCRVANLKRRAVSWIRQEDLKVLATDGVTFTTDSRFQVRVWRRGVVWAWDLEIEGAVLEDAGVYECQVNTRPKISHLINLHVHAGGAVIRGPSEVYVEAGSRLLLTCWVQSPPRPPPSITWLHDLQPVHLTQARGGVSLEEAREEARATTRLSLTSVMPKDAGNYTCLPDALDPATVSVFVLRDEEARAMHTDGASNTVAPCLPLLPLLALALALT